MIDTFLNILYVLQQLLDLRDAHLLLHLLNKPFLKVDNVCILIIFAEVNIFQESVSYVLLVLFGKMNFLLKNFKKKGQIYNGLL